jgi:hypothetical protein
MHHLPGASAVGFRIALFSLLCIAAADNTLPRMIDSSSCDTAQKKALSDRSISLPDNASDSSGIALQSSGKALSVQLGEFHRFKGIYGLLAGTLGICAGVILLDKTDSVPLAISSMTLGGISIGIGLWEIKLGSAFLKNQSHFPQGSP